MVAAEGLKSSPRRACREQPPRHRLPFLRRLPADTGLSRRCPPGLARHLQNTANATPSWRLRGPSLARRGRGVSRATGQRLSPGLPGSRGPRPLEPDGSPPWGVSKGALNSRVKFTESCTRSLTDGRYSSKLISEAGPWPLSPDTPVTLFPGHGNFFAARQLAVPLRFPLVLPARNLEILE